MILSLLLFQDINLQEWVKTLGFPIVVAIAFLYFGWKVYLNITAQVKEKDDLLKTEIEKGQVFRGALIDSQNTLAHTQNRIAVTQDKMSESLTAHLETLQDMNVTMQGSCKFTKQKGE